MKKIYHSAIIGCGAAAGGYDEKSKFRHVFTHAMAYKKHPRFTLIAIAETNPYRRAEFQKIWDVQNAYRDHLRMLSEENLDMVSVCVPDALHFPIVRDIVKYGNVKCILVEKPIAASLEDAQEMLRLCRDKKTSLFVNYNRLWDPLHSAVRALIRGRFLGGIQGGSAYYVHGIKHNGTTMINVLRFLLGCNVRKVAALESCPGKFKGDAVLDGVLTFDKGINVALFGADKGSYGHSIFELDLVGNRGRVRISDNGYHAKFYRTREYRRYSGVNELAPIAPLKNLSESGMSRTLLYTLDEIAKSIDCGIPVFKYAEAAVGDMRIAEALLKSARLGNRAVKI